MISDFKSQGVKTVLITEPFILTTSKKWQEASDKKLLKLTTKIVTNPENGDVKLYFSQKLCLKKKHTI